MYQYFIYMYNIAICSVGELFGGVERHILTFITGIRTQGVYPSLLLFHDGELASQAREQGVEPIILPNRNRSLLTTVRTLARILKQRQIQVVHVHGYKATFFCALARYWYPCRIVKTEHGLPEPIAGKPLYLLRDRLYHFLDNAATQIANATVCYVTQELQAHYRRWHSNLRVCVIPNGVANMDRHQLPRPSELNTKWFNLVVVGRLDTVKGLHVAIQALASESPQPDVHLHIIGTGPCGPELHDQAEALGISQRVHFLGFRRNALDYIAYCDTLLMPSLHEGLPYTLLEAMAFGTAIVASCVGGLAEVLQDDVTALLVPPRDTKALAHAITRLHDDSEASSPVG